MKDFSLEEQQLIKKASAKRTGFTQRPDWIQIFSYVIFLWGIFSQFLVALPALSHLGLQIFFTGLVLLSSCVLGVLAVLTAITDPTDEHVLITRYMNKVKKEDYAPKYLNFFCDNCQSYVSESVKHCRSCNRCVKDFDHHCRWINNCIAASNYPKFISLVKAVIVYGFTNFLSRAVGIAILLTDLETPIENKRFAILSPSVIPYFIVLGTETVIYLALTIVSLNFLKYHAWLKANNLTTFSHIQQLRKEAPPPMRERERSAILGSATPSTAKVSSAKVVPVMKQQTRKDKTEFRKVQVEELPHQEQGEEFRHDPQHGGTQFQVKIANNRSSASSDQKVNRAVKIESSNSKIRSPKAKAIKKTNDMMDNRTRVSPLITKESRIQPAASKQRRDSSSVAKEADRRIEMQPVGGIAKEQEASDTKPNLARRVLPVMSKRTADEAEGSSFEKTLRQSSHPVQSQIKQLEEVDRPEPFSPYERSEDRMIPLDGRYQEELSVTARQSQTMHNSDTVTNQDRDSQLAERRSENEKSFVSLEEDQVDQNHTDPDIELAESARQQSLAKTINQRRKELGHQDPS